MSNSRAKGLIVTPQETLPSIKRVSVAGCNQSGMTHSGNKTKQMHLFLKFIFRIKLYMFRTVPLSIIRSFSLYTQQ